MLLQRYSPTQAAAMVGVSASTIRAWCKEFSDYLSDNANPQPGTDRALLPGDVAILQKVKELREGGAGIVDILQALTESPTEALQPYIDSAVTHPPPLPITPTESPQQGPQAIELYATVLQSVGALQARMDALQAQQDSQAQAATGRVTLFAVGVLVGLVLALIVVGVLWLLP